MGAGWLCLGFAAVSGDTQVLEAFLKLGFIPYKDEIWAAIQKASQRGNTEILTGLFTCCKNDWQPVELADLLLLAVKNNCLPLASAVVEQGANVNSASFEKSLLFYTLPGDKRDMFVFLCEHGCTCESMEDMLSYAFRYTALRISEYIRANCLPPPPPQEETSQADAELSHSSPRPAIQNAIEDIYNSRRSRYYHRLISEKLITDRDLAIRLQSMLPRTLSFI